MDRRVRRVASRSSPRVLGRARARAAGWLPVCGVLAVAAAATLAGVRSEALAPRTKSADAPTPTADPGVVPLADAAAAPAAARLDPVVELGRRLFFDPGASHSTRVSCASCHQPEHGFGDPLAVSRDDFGVTARHSQSLLDLAGGAAFHWDGEFTSIEQLVAARTGDTRTTSGGYRSPDSFSASDANVLKVTPVAETLAAAGTYREGFEAAFGDPQPTRERLATAVAAYVRTLTSTPSAFDRYRAGDLGALPDAARRGFDLFRGRAGCAQCHTVEGQKPTFTDEAFHNTGFTSRRGDESARARRSKLVSPSHDPGEGRGAVSKRDEDLRRFKTPSLRDVALRAPYMHDGSLPTLAAVVRYYALECGKVKDEGLDAHLKPFDEGASQADLERDVADLVAFLHTLTGERRAGLAPARWTERAERMRIRLVDAQSGSAYRGQVLVAPGGDMLPGADAAAGVALRLTPDADGWISLAPFASTHVELSLPGTNLRPATGTLVPDTCAEVTLKVGPDPNPGFEAGRVVFSGAAGTRVLRR